MPSFPLWKMPATDYTLCGRRQRSDEDNKLFAYRNYLCSSGSSPTLPLRLPNKCTRMFNFRDVFAPVTDHALWQPDLHWPSHASRYQSSWNIWTHWFQIYGKWSVQTSKQANIHTHVLNKVTLVWGSLRLAPTIGSVPWTMGWCTHVSKTILLDHYPSPLLLK